MNVDRKNLLYKLQKQEHLFGAGPVDCVEVHREKSDFELGQQTKSFIATQLQGYDVKTVLEQEIVSGGPFPIVKNQNYVFFACTPRNAVHERPAD